MTRTTNAADGLLAGLTAGKAQALADRSIAATNAAVSQLDLSRIQPRPGGDTRPPHASHVLRLAESLAALGLLEPLVVDRHGRLVAGLTRLQALRLLAMPGEARAAAWSELAKAQGCKPPPAELRLLRELVPHASLQAGKVPVRLLDFDAEQDPAAALAAEVAENQQRRDYSAAEVRALADRLRAAGYHDGIGRPKKGAKALRPVLAAVIGRTDRTVRRTLNAATTPTAPPVGAELRAAVAGLLRAVERLQAASKGHRRATKAKRLAERLAFVVKAAPAVQAEAEELGA